MLGLGIKTAAIITTLALFGTAFVYNGSQDEAMNFLVVGVDDAAENTDVISVLRLDAAQGKVAFIQIPRDTYCNLDVYKNKINHIYSFARSQGKSEAESAFELRSFLNDVLSIKIDGHVLLDQNSFLRLVDSIGGVDVELSRDVTLYNGDEVLLSLSKGVNHLDAESAMLFVRHRAGYPRADIERLEMQRIFLSGLFNTLMSKVSLSEMLRAASILKTCETDIQTKSIISLFGKRKSFSNAVLDGAVLPGEAIKGDNGAWYYALNKRGCDELLSRVFAVESGSFDKDKRFLNESDENFRNVYFR